MPLLSPERGKDVQKMPVSSSQGILCPARPTRIRGVASLVALCALGVLSAPRAALAQTFVVDQQQSQSNGDSLLQVNEPLGQEFIPTAVSLNRIVLNTEDFDLDDALGAVLQVDVRLGSVEGALLGTSNAVSLEDGFFGNTIFDFATPVGLTPGSTHLFFARKISGGLWGIADFVGPPDAYPFGSAIVAGEPDPDRDLLFQTGFLSTALAPMPEPATLLLLLCGMPALIGALRVRPTRR